MSSAETTELKLKSTPTGGVEAAHSPYYRRLLSAGYKGYLQGIIGGASLYGVLGLAIGALAAAPFVATLGLAGVASLARAAGGVGVVKGASTFGNIGSTAAINAESADLSEQRRYLLDRYHDLPEGPEADREAAEIKKQLKGLQSEVIQRPPFFHWKTVAICAAVGALIAIALCSPIGAAIFGESAVAHVFTALGFHVAGGVATIATAAEGAGALAGATAAHGIALTTLGAALGTGLGALAGAVIGIDRYYVRKWFDATEGVVHSSSHKESALEARSYLVGRLREAEKQDQIVKQNIDYRA
jgi:hypothetical protein